MDPNRSPWTLGGSFLGLMLCLLALLFRAQDSPTDVPLPFPAADSFSDRQLAGSFGWPLSATECSPRAWSKLPGIGPVLARRLASHAEAGYLRYPSDLLRVRGIGSKMAGRLEPWILWPSDLEPPQTDPKLSCGRGKNQ